ncbi:MAG: preprotein translocase subunit SecG [Planctomycetota bacterium]|jgi:preprotein translocase subunit SecG
MIEPILWVLFMMGCVVVSGVILLQEGKGGGLGEAFGGAGAQTFGVKAEGINRFTAYVTIGVIVLAIAITIVRTGSGSGVTAGLADTVPVGEQPAGGAADTGGAGGDHDHDGDGVPDHN